MRENGTLTYLLGDNLGSSTVVLNTTGSIVSEERYFPFGELRDGAWSLNTNFGFTGQRRLEGTGLLDYDARMYSPKTGRFISPDAILPDLKNPQALNRFTYVLNNPLRYTDPSGHCPWCIVTAAAGAAIGVGLYSWNVSRTTQNWDLGEAITVGVVGAGAGALIGTGVGAGFGGAALAAIATSGGVGMASAGIGYFGYNIATKSDYNSTDFLIATAVGGATGAVGQAGAATTLTGAIALNGGASVIQYGATKISHGQTPTLQGVAWSGFWGMAGGAIGGANTPIEDLGKGSGPTGMSFDLDNPQFKTILQGELFQNVTGGALRTATATAVSGIPEPQPKRNNNYKKSKYLALE